MREYSDIYYLISYQKFFLHLMISLEGYYLKNRKRVYIELNSNNIIIIISLIYIIAFMMKVSNLFLKYRFFMTIQTNLQEVHGGFSYLAVAEFLEILRAT